MPVVDDLMKGFLRVPLRRNSYKRDNYTSVDLGLTKTQIRIADDIISAGGGDLIPTAPSFWDIAGYKYKSQTHHHCQYAPSSDSNKCHAVDFGADEKNRYKLLQMYFRLEKNWPGGLGIGVPAIGSDGHNYGAHAHLHVDLHPTKGRRRWIERTIDRKDDIGSTDPRYEGAIRSAMGVYGYYDRSVGLSNALDEQINQSSLIVPASIAGAAFGVVQTGRIDSGTLVYAVGGGLAGYAIEKISDQIFKNYKIFS